MMRGEVWWADLPAPTGSGPGFRRPVLVVQEDAFTASRIQTVIVVVVTSNLLLGAAPGNVALPADESLLPRDSIINVSQVITLDKGLLTDYVSTLSSAVMTRVDDGLRLVLAL